MTEPVPEIVQKLVEELKSLLENSLLLDPESAKPQIERAGKIRMELYYRGYSVDWSAHVSLADLTKIIINLKVYKTEEDATEKDAAAYDKEFLKSAGIKMD